MSPRDMLSCEAPENKNHKLESYPQIADRIAKQERERERERERETQREIQKKQKRDQGNIGKQLLAGHDTKPKERGK